MIIVMEENAPEEQIVRVVDRLVNLGFDIHRSTGARYTILGAVGSRITDIRELELLDGVNVAALGLMAAVGVQLGREAIVDVWTVGLAVLSAVLLIRWKVNATWLVALGAAAGLIRWQLG